MIEMLHSIDTKSYFQSPVEQVGPYSMWQIAHSEFLKKVSSTDPQNNLRWNIVSDWLTEKDPLKYTMKANPCFAGVGINQDLQIRIFHLSSHPEQIEEKLGNLGIQRGIFGVTRYHDPRITGYLTNSLHLTPVHYYGADNKAAFNVMVNQKEVYCSFS